MDTLAMALVAQMYARLYREDKFLCGMREDGVLLLAKGFFEEFPEYEEDATYAWAYRHGVKFYCLKEKECE